MAVEDVEWQERYGDQSYKSRSLLAIRVALFALFFSQVVVLPSLAVYLSTLSAPTSMLGYCIAATCIGELCANNIFSILYDGRPAREVVVGALMLNVFASILYSVAPHRLFVLASRFLIGFSGGVQAPLMTMVGAFTNRYNRAEALAGVRAMYMLAFILGAGLSTSVTFVHMHNPGLPLDAMQHSVPTYVSEGKAAAQGEVSSAQAATQKAIGQVSFAAARALGEQGNNTTSIAGRAAMVWRHPFQLFSAAGEKSLAKGLSAWEVDEDRDLLREVRNDSMKASLLPAAFAKDAQRFAKDAQSLVTSVSRIFSASDAAQAKRVGASTGSLAALKGLQRSRTAVAAQAAAAAAAAASAMETHREKQERSDGLPTYTSGPVFHFAAEQPRAGRGGNARGGMATSGLGGDARQAGNTDGKLLIRGLAAIMHDISQKERLATEALGQANGGAGGGSEGEEGARREGQQDMQRDIDALKRALGGGHRRLLAASLPSSSSWGVAHWVEEAEEQVAAASHVFADAPMLSGGSGNSSAEEGDGESDTGRPGPSIVVTSDTVPEGSDVETDAQLERNSGGNEYYLPSYFTAFVGHGLRAPGYLAALGSVLAAVFVWFNLGEGPRKALTKRVPLAHLSPRSLAYFYPLIACVGLEFAAQLALVSVEVLVPPLLRMWRGWSCDAIAVFLIAVAASGVTGLALLDMLEKRQPLRRLMFWAAFVVLLGFAHCLPWDGQRLNAWQFGLGACLCALGFMPLSAMANQVVSAAVVKVYSEDGELVWLGLFWGLTRVPARTLGPIVLVFFLIHDPSGALCYVTLASITALAILLLFMLRTALITPGLLSGSSCNCKPQPQRLLPLQTPSPYPILSRMAHARVAQGVVCCLPRRFCGCSWILSHSQSSPLVSS